MRIEAQKQAFKIVDCLDNARWLELKKGRPLVNYYYGSESITDPIKKAEYIILSHWLTYICDRQMKYQKIWDNGSYIFSWLVAQYQNQKDYHTLKDFLTQPISRVEKGNNDQNEELLERYTWIEFYRLKKGDDKKVKCRFIVKGDGNDRVTADDDGYVRFASRYVATDVVAIIRTLLVLKEKGDLNEYLKEKGDYRNSEDSMRKLLYRMYDLSYNGIGQYTTEGKKSIYPMERSELFSKEPKAIRGAEPVDETKYFKSKIFESKRAICALRDYFKKDEFEEHIKILVGNDFYHLYDQLWQLELPGDVWNNKESFGECISGVGIQSSKSALLNRVLREVYDALKSAYHSEVVGYPEHFDITFDFVPRMCEKKDCHICLFGKLNPTKENSFSNESFKEYCHKKEDCYCSVLLKYCGYSVLCKDAKKNRACVCNLMGNL